MAAVKNTTPATADELHAALAAIEAQERIEQERQASVIQQARAARAQKSYDAARAMEEELQATGTVRYEAAVAAAVTGDLNGAYSEFVGYLGTISARRLARSDAQSAAHLLGREPHTNADLAYRPQPFSDFIDSNQHKAVEASANITVTAYIEPDIDDIEAAIAYLEQVK
ncbi:hypothetical protein [Cryobacterium lyxosi]|uniref:Uncharacterized protein n=1 Tax=Cryobacterium lyxosi TaxID=1259228 RepID=A0A4R8ZHE6_9MICO|nr:hypothetical protein [Cryobacterium lyxosi]TFD25865.1 hypothetical protein E3T27_08655 [Cryobacterium lyxosi]